MRHLHSELPFYFMRVLILLAAALCAACGTESELDKINTKRIVLPGGQTIIAEMLTHPTDMMRGMMFRESLPDDRGMLFVHGGPGNYPYYTYQVKIPLDILWLNRTRTIVEISPDTPPCKTKASECPRYGGNHEALFVLELAGGAVAKYNLKLGQTLSF